MNNSKNNILKTNKEVGFLYKKCKKIKPSTISMIGLVPEYNDVIKKYKGDIDDDVIYELVRTKFKEMYDSKSAYRTAKGVLKKISKEVKGDASAWEKD